MKMARLNFTQADLEIHLNAVKKINAQIEKLKKTKEKHLIGIKEKRGELNGTIGK